MAIPAPVHWRTLCADIVVDAVVRIGKRALKNRAAIALAAAAFVGILFLGIPFPVIVFSAALIGFVGGTMGLAAFQGGNNHTLGDSFDLPHAETHAILLPHSAAYNFASAADVLGPPR